MYGMSNELVNALWKRIDQLARTSICPSDDLLELTPFDVPDAASATTHNKRGPAAKVGASAGPCAPLRGVRRDDRGPEAPSSLGSETSSAAPTLADGLQSSSSSCAPRPAQRNARLDLSDAPENMPNFYGGFDDGCEVSYYGVWFDGNVFEKNDFFEELAVHKSRAADACDRADEVPEIVLLNGEPWIMGPSGASGRVRYRFRLLRGGVTLLIHNNPGERFPGVRARFGYEALFNRDLYDVNAEIRELLAAIGFDVRKETLSRVDMQVTLATSFDWVAKAFNEGRIVARVRQWSRWERNTDDGLTLQSLRGGSALQVAIYDKFRECLDKRQEQKLNDLSPLMENSTDFGLTRIEFRFKREALSYFDLNSVADFTERLPDVVDYVTRRWFRVLNSPKVRGCENKQETAQEWNWVRYAFESAFCNGQKSSAPLTRDRSKVLERKLIMKQACGCITSATAFDRETSTMTYDEYKDFVIGLINDEMPELYAGYLKKRADYEVRVLAQSDDLTAELLLNRNGCATCERIPF